jgi:hypothetical protein
MRVGGIRGGLGSSGLPSRCGGGCGDAARKVRFSTAVAPPSRHSTTWWAWRCVGGRAQPGNVQPLSRSATARRMWAGMMRVARPMSRGRDRASRPMVTVSWGRSPPSMTSLVSSRPRLTHSARPWPRRWSALRNGVGPSSAGGGGGVRASIWAAKRVAVSGSRSPSRCSHPLARQSRASRLAGSARSFSLGWQPSGSRRGAIWRSRNRRSAAGSTALAASTRAGSASVQASGDTASESRSWNRVSSSRCPPLISPEASAASAWG